MPLDPAETWVFGYGSLMWNPGFEFAEARRARLTGYHRAFCIYSIHYRGTERQPGLVLGLDRGGVCDGLAFRIAPERWAETLAYLRRRELIYGVYREALVPVALAPAPPHPAVRIELSPVHPKPGSAMRESGEAARDAPASPSPLPDGERSEAIPRSLGGEGATTVWAVAYIAERAHPAYAGRLTLAREAALIRRSAGRGGTNLAYLASTRRHLADLGIREPRLDRLATLAGTLALARAAASPDARPLRARAGLSSSWAARSLPRPLTVRDNRFGHRAKMG